MLMNRIRTWLPAIVLLALPSLSHAHPGHDAGGFIHGVEHPPGGLDHILAMIAVGLWAVQLGGRAFYLVPLSFVGAMAAGGVLGMAGVPVPFVEQGIMTSILILGLLIAAAVRVPLWAGILLLGSFAVFHGYAHGAEMPGNASGLAYAAGFVLATAALHLAGMGLGMALGRLARLKLVRVAGLAIAAAGLFLAVS